MPIKKTRFIDDYMEPAFSLGRLLTTGRDDLVTEPEKAGLKEQ